MFGVCATCQSNGFAKVRMPGEIQHKDIMIVGDCPTALEVRNNRIMTGRAVDILRQAMKQVGLPTDEQHTHFTTALKCAVPKRKGKTMPVESFRNCRNMLLQEIKAVKPKIIIPLGKYATQCIANDFKLKITTAYGRQIEVPDLEGYTIIPIMHPAMLIRAPGDYKPFLASLQLIHTVYTKGKIETPDIVKWLVVDTDEKFDQLMDIIRHKHKYNKLPYVACDIETTGLDYRIAEFCVMGMAISYTECYVFARSIKPRIKELWSVLKGHTKVIWHHGKYDSKVMWRRGLGIIPHDEDTIYQHYVLDETSAHDLGSLTKIFLQAPEYKFKMNQNFKAVTLETYDSFFDSLCERASVDCCYSLKLFDELNKHLDKDPKLKTLYNNLMMPAAKFLSRVERNGMLVNPKPLEELGVRYEKLLLEIKEDIETIAADFWDPDLYKQEKKAKTAGNIFNPGSPKQMSWMVFNRLKLKPRIRKGDSTNKEVLHSIEPSHPLVDAVLHYRSVQKEHSTYVKGILNARDEDGRVRSTFSLHITATGRLSSKEPNVQNIPSSFGVGNVRRAFVAPPGKILMECDYSGAELRWLACLSGDKILKKIFREGRNLHDETSMALFGPNFTKQDRMRAKAVNFGIPYGREAKSLADEFDISITEAQQLIDDWLNAYPGAKQYLQNCADTVLRGGFLETPFYRRRRFGLVTPEALHALQNEARNMPIQSSSSDTLLVAAMRAEKTLKEQYGTEIVNLIHDSMLLEVPAEREIIRTVGKYVTDIMISTPQDLFNLDVPFAADIDLAPTWGDVAGYDLKTELVTVKIDGKKKQMDVMDFISYINNKVS